MRSIRKRKTNDHEAEIRKGELIVERMKLAVEIAKMSAEVACVMAQSRYPKSGAVGGAFSSAKTQTVSGTKQEPKEFNIIVKDTALLETLKNYKWSTR